MQDTTFVLMLIITLLLCIIAYFNHRLNDCQKQIDVLGTLTFGLMDALGQTSNTLKDMSQVLEDILYDIGEDEEEESDQESK